jgi:hypothetical protein
MSRLLTFFVSRRGCGRSERGWYFERLHQPSDCGIGNDGFSRWSGARDPGSGDRRNRSAPPVALTPGVVAVDSKGTLGSTTLSLPGAITGVAQLQVQLPRGLSPGPYSLTPMLDGTPLRERLILVWTRSN